MSLTPLMRRLKSCAITAALAAVTLVAPAPALAAPPYDPLDVIAYEVWRDDSSMTEAQIQRFLRARTGVLDTLVTADHAGVRKPASRIIFEAAQYWDLNPKVILATLQKEQSLLTKSAPSAKTLREAMGCGVFPGSTERYAGFGTQVWHGARKLSTYETDFQWKPGMRKEVTVRAASGSARNRAIVPKNAATFALYTYTPYYPQRLFWDVYVRYFGDPRRLPAARPVHRLVDLESGAFLYTSSTAERFAWTTREPDMIRYDGVAFAVNRALPRNDIPLMRLFDPHARVWAYTTDPARRDALLADPEASWVASGTVCNVAALAPDVRPIFALESTWGGGTLLTASSAERTDLTSGDPAPFIDRGSSFGIAIR